MSRPNLDLGDVLPLVRRLAGTPDPLALYAALTDGGTRPDTLLLESADAATGQGEKSVLLPRTMLRLECRGQEVRAVPLTPNGEGLRDWLQARLTGRASLRREGDDLVARFTPVAGERDEQSRLLAAGPLDALRAVVLHPRLVSSPAPLAHLAAGVFAYDLVDLFERLPPPRADPLGFPDYIFWVPEQVLVLDHVHRATTVIVHVVGGDNAEASYHDAVRAVESLVLAVQAGEVKGRTPAVPHDRTVSGHSPGPRRADLDDSQYADLVSRLKAHIVAGDVFQVVPSRTFTAPCPDPFVAYRKLRAANPSPYMFFVRSPDAVLLGASPETAVKVAGTPRLISLRPIAGTAPRGRHPDGSIDRELDARLQAALLTDAKELAEHMMLVDLARNDVARVSRPGSRRVSQLLTVDRYQHVMHLVSEVEGELASGLDALHAYAASLNMGTLVGAPKIRAAELLREHERSKRGPYGGAVGYLTHDGEMDTAIVIRSAYVRDGTAYVRAGAGVVLDSNPASEAAETIRKAAAVLDALAPAVAP